MSATSNRMFGYMLSALTTRFISPLARVLLEKFEDPGWNFTLVNIMAWPEGMLQEP